MKRRLLALMIAAQLTATGALAQTPEPSTDPTTGQTPDTSAPGAASSGFGSDWSSTLGIAMLGQDTTTVRPAAELVTQWGTLSEDDRSVIRRDCMVFMQQPGGDTGLPAPGTGAGTDVTTDQL